MAVYKGIDEIVIMLTRALSHRRLYFADHPKVLAMCRGLEERLEVFLKRTELDKLFIGVADGKLVFEGRYLVGPSIAGGQLVQLARKLHCGGFLLRPHTDAAEFGRFLAMAASCREPTADLNDSRALLASAGIARIGLSAEYHNMSGILVEEDRETWRGKDSAGHELPSPILVYQALFDVVSDAHGNALRNHNLDIDGARSVSEHLLQSTRASFTDIMQLMHYPDYDTYTVGHSVRVATLAVHLGDRMGLTTERLLELGTAALLHDVGKSKIPEEILYKPGRLDKGEFWIVKAHAELGAEILLEHRTATPLDVAAAFGHHIRHDGGGYPDRPEWAVRHPVTALLQVCDVFEALTAIRPYKPPLSPRAAFEIMVKDKGAFDPALLRVFVGALGLYPPGNQVRLSDGSFAIVTAAGQRIDAPQVRITHDAAGTPLPEEERCVVNLSSGERADLTVAELLLDPELLPA